MVCSFQYPDESILTLQTMMQLDYNPKAFLGGPGALTQAIYNIFAGTADGCMFEGAWSPAHEPRGQRLLRQAWSLSSATTRRTSTSGDP